MPAEVTAQLAHTCQARLLVQQVGNTLRVEVELVHEESDCSGINIACTRAHDEAFEWGEAHRRIYALAILDSCDGGSVADVAGDDALGLCLYAQELADALTDVAVAGAVEAVATHPILLIEVVG